MIHIEIKASLEKLWSSLCFFLLFCPHVTNVMWLWLCGRYDTRVLCFWWWSFGCCGDAIILKWWWWFSTGGGDFQVVAMIFNPFCIAGLVTHQGGWRHHVPAHKTLCPVILLLITIITIIITIIIIITMISIDRVLEFYQYWISSNKNYGSTQDWRKSSNLLRRGWVELGLVLPTLSLLIASRIW